MRINNMSIRFIRLTFAAVLLGLAQACSFGGMSDLEEFVATAYKDKKPEIEPLPEIQPYKGFSYSAVKSADPFSIANIIDTRGDEAVLNGESPDGNRRREALEAYPLDALRMVGTMEQEEQPWVIVQTSDGTAHRATVGNYMGQNDGKIKQIKLEEQTVVLAELVRNTAGRWVARDVEITIDE